MSVILFVICDATCRFYLGTKQLHYHSYRLLICIFVPLQDFCFKLNLVGRCNSNLVTFCKGCIGNIYISGNVNVVLALISIESSKILKFNLFVCFFYALLFVYISYCQFVHKTKISLYT